MSNPMAAIDFISRVLRGPAHSLRRWWQSRSTPAGRYIVNGSDLAGGRYLAEHTGLSGLVRDSRAESARLVSFLMLPGADFPRILHAKRGGPPFLRNEVCLQSESLPDERSSAIRRIVLARGSSRASKYRGGDSRQPLFRTIALRLPRLRPPTCWFHPPARLLLLLERFARTGWGALRLLWRGVAVYAGFRVRV